MLKRVVKREYIYTLNQPIEYCSTYRQTAHLNVKMICAKARRR